MRASARAPAAPPPGGLLAAWAAGAGLHAALLAAVLWLPGRAPPAAPPVEEGVPLLWSGPEGAAEGEGGREEGGSAVPSASSEAPTAEAPPGEAPRPPEKSDEIRPDERFSLPERSAATTPEGDGPPLPPPPPPSPRPPPRPALAAAPAPAAPGRGTDASSVPALVAAMGAVRLGAVAGAPVEDRGVGAPRPGCAEAIGYPDEARSSALVGAVGLRLRVRDDGGVVEARVVETSGSVLLDEAARRGIRRCRFEPALRGGAPVWASHDYRVVFRLR